MSEKPTPDFTSPIAGRIEVRQPCPWCGDQQMIPRSQFDEHVMRLHPDVRTAEYRAAAEAHNARLAFRGTQHTTETGETAPAVLAVAGNPLVQGRCPACGWATLLLADGGYLTCSRLECPRPDAASTLLERDPRTPADTGLRDRIAAAFGDFVAREGTMCGSKYDAADAVLAVLPAPADRAAVLREAAEVADEEARRLYDDMGQQAAAGARLVGARLRRMADEPQPGEPGRRTITWDEHNRAWHAIEGAAGEHGADPSTILTAVCHALRIDEPTTEARQDGADHVCNTVQARGHMDETLGYLICGLCGKRQDGGAS